MSQNTTTLEIDQAPTEASSFLIPAAHLPLDSPRSSGSLESNASTSITPPSLDTSHSTTSTSSTTSASPSLSPSILIRSTSLPPSHSSSTSTSPNVTFAPLPQIDLRKRKPSPQLGVAARSRLLQHRRMLRDRGLNPDDPHTQHSYPYGSGTGIAGGKDTVMVDCFGGDDGPVEIRDAQPGVDADEEAAAQYHRSRARSDPAEDALVSLGRFVKGAGRTLWRSLSMRDLRSREREDAAAETRGPQTEHQGGCDQDQGHEGEAAVSTSQPQGQALDERARSGSLTGERRIPTPKKKAGHLFEEHHDRDPHPHCEEGGVWEEEIDEESWKRLLSTSHARPSADSVDVKPSPSIPKSSTDLASHRTSIVEVVVRKPSTTTRVR